MRLMGIIIVALLAITMAIFPISMPQAAASMGPEHPVTADIGYAHATFDGVHEHAAVMASCDDVVASGCSDHDPGPHDPAGPNCCGMGMCHAFQLSVTPILNSPALSFAPVAIAGDEQVASAVSGRIDRPPRTV